MYFSALTRQKNYYEDFALLVLNEVARDAELSKFREMVRVFQFQGSGIINWRF